MCTTISGVCEHACPTMEKRTLTMTQPPGPLQAAHTHVILASLGNRGAQAVRKFLFVHREFEEFLWLVHQFLR